MLVTWEGDTASCCWCYGNAYVSAGVWSKANLIDQTNERNVAQSINRCQKCASTDFVWRRHIGVTGVWQCDTVTRSLLGEPGYIIRNLRHSPSKWNLNIVSWLCYGNFNTNVTMPKVTQLVHKAVYTTHSHPLTSYRTLYDKTALY